MYYGDSIAEKAMMRLNAKIKKTFAQAYREMTEKLQSHTKQFEKDDKKYREMVRNGKLKKSDYNKWKQEQVFTGRQWSNMVSDITSQIANADKTTERMINGERRAVFQENVNYSSYNIDKDYNFGLTFTIYDSATVTRLIKDDPELLPDVKIDPDGYKNWSKKLVTSAVTQSIIQGETIPQTAERIGKKLSSSNEKAMTRVARTAMTSAQNSGRIEAMHNAQGMGIAVKKLWIATLDRRTRDAHGELDGQTAEVDDPFHSSLGDIYYPGDPNANPQNTWNCRCSLGWEYPEYKNQYDTRAAREYVSEDDEIGHTVEIQHMTYKEWKDWLENGKATPVKVPEPPPKTPEEQIKEKLSAGNADLYEVGKIFAGIIHEKIKNALVGRDIEGIKRELEQAEFDQELIALKNAREKLDSVFITNFLQRQKIPDEDIKIITDALKIAGWNETKIKVMFTNKLESRMSFSEQAPIENAINRKYKEKVKKINELKEKLQNDQSEVKFHDSAKILKDTLSQFRVMGSDGIDIDTHLNHSRSPMKAVVADAYSYYPRDWVESSVRRGKLTPKKVDRGYYSDYNQEIAISSYRGPEGSFGTAIHELGHRMERSVSGILDAEREYYAKRTQGENLEWLGQGYDNSEVSRKDKFINPYMGKDYKGVAFELVSMGFQYAYTDPQLLAQDEDMESWIYGLLLTK